MCLMTFRSLATDLRGIFRIIFPDVVKMYLVFSHVKPCDSLTICVFLWLMKIPSSSAMASISFSRVFRYSLFG